MAQTPKKKGLAAGAEAVTFRRQLTPDDFYAPLQSNSPLACGEIILLIDEVLQYPDLYPGSSLLQQALYTVFVLAIEDRNRVALSAAGACQSLLKVMHLFPHKKKIQLFGCGAVANLAYINSKNQDLLVEHGAVNQVITSMKLYPKTKELQIHGCTAIRNLCLDHPFNASLFGEYGGRLVVNVCFLHFAEDPAITHWAHEALKLLPERYNPLMPYVVNEVIETKIEINSSANQESNQQNEEEGQTTKLTNEEIEEELRIASLEELRIAEEEEERGDRKDDYDHDDEDGRGMNEVFLQEEKEDDNLSITSSRRSIDL